MIRALANHVAMQLFFTLIGLGASALAMPGTLVIGTVVSHRNVAGQGGIAVCLHVIEMPAVDGKPARRVMIGSTDWPNGRTCENEPAYLQTDGTQIKIQITTDDYVGGTRDINGHHGYSIAVVATQAADLMWQPTAWILGRNPTAPLDEHRRQLFESVTEVEIHRLNELPSKAFPSEFARIRKVLVGQNVISKMALPVWQQPGGDMAFPPSGSKAKPGENLTITDVLACSAYPVRNVAFDCGSDPGVRHRNIVIVLFNGSQPRTLPSAPPSGGNQGSGLSDVMNQLTCVFGRAVDCIAANQRQQLNELGRLRGSMQQSSGEADWQANELWKFSQTGPEVVFSLSEEEAASAQLKPVVDGHLGRFVDLSKVDSTH